ncbi:hypothetical protein BOTBODRAFT_82396, partial [Botryobasidium botryosum FD-172 SS1]
DGRTPLHHAARWCRSSVIQFLLDSGIDPRICDPNGRTALHSALERPDCAQSSRISVLIKAGADSNARDDCGRTPLQLAVQSHPPSVTQFLLQSGADPHSR